MEEPVFALEEVKNHSKEEDCWLVIDGFVYDVTKFLDEHPGGFDIILQNTGTRRALPRGKLLLSTTGGNGAHRAVAKCRQGCHRGVRGDRPQQSSARAALTIQNRQVQGVPPLHTQKIN